MTVLNRLSTTLQRKDEHPNIELARHIAATGDAVAIRELIDNLHHKIKGIRYDCIKVLYETGAIEPSLISPYLKNFATLLKDKDNRMQWGAMTALHAIARESPKAVHALLPELAEAAGKGSVITRDNYVGILISLYNVNAYTDNAFALLNEQLQISPSNQLPMYAEKLQPVIADRHKATLAKTLNTRLGDIEQESKKKRVEKVLKKIQVK
ncbi:MAG TPA: hypothetical protein VM802_31945 [Chitinophaga sp.]|uniref:hypothetical protein n=1 Tax=Chitinophaga sp. TaxID=1869181 RepID=UPI002CA08B98|nr:hypothetical protein [Chitinophaga sp.]HVI49523.1 hypothetical protein [Chitinophaga sp.]